MADDLHKSSPASDLYDRDYLAWTEVQAGALRARRDGENALDYDNLAEEIEDLGKSEQRACDSQVNNIIEHLLKVEFVGPAQTIPHWSKEIYGFRRELNYRRTAMIEHRIRPRLDKMFMQAVKALVIGRMLDDAQTVLAVMSGYEWDQIVDEDWYPEPRYTDD